VQQGSTSSISLNFEDLVPKWPFLIKW
jgi:hypothetical protein